MSHRFGRKKIFVLSLTLLLMSLCVSAVMLRPASAAASTLAQAGAQSGRTIGVAVEANLLGNNPYTNIIQTQFDGVTPGNEMKWQTTEPQQGVFNFGPADQIVSFAQQHNMKIRGHTLVWHSQLASWVNSVPASQILSVMENHITTEMTHFKGEIWYWDVVNEAFNDDGTRRSDVFQNEIGNSYIEDAFRTARAADPNAKLCYNDYNIEDMNSAKSQAVYAMVADFKNRGVPIDCVGFQSHFITGQVPADFQATLQKFANLGIDVQITELDDRMPTPPSQANINQQNIDYANVAKACLAVSRCNDITIWGVGEPDSWIPSTFPGQGNALLYDSNYQPKPAYTAFLNALGGSAATPTPTPTNGTTPTPTPTRGTTPTPTPPPGGGGCSVHYVVSNQWNTGFTATVNIINTGSTSINGWTLQFTFPNGQVIQSGAWNGNFTQSGSAVTITNLSYNGSIAPGGGTLSSPPGFNASWSGANSSPTAFTLNGTACSVV